MSRIKAANTLVHYLCTVWEAAGLTWTADNEAEVRGLVDDLLDDAAASANTIAKARTGEPQ